MKILYAGMMYDYGIQERGFSFEHYNFYDTLVHMGHDVTYFDFMSLHKQFGSTAMTQMLRNKINEIKPDLLFTFLFTNEFDVDILTKITTESSTITFNWFADDHWRFDSFSKHWAKCFQFISTTDKLSLEKYRSIGYQNALLTQWGVNHFLYQKKNNPFLYDVTFVGQAHGDRHAVVKHLKENDINIITRGTYWNVKRFHRYLNKMRLMSELHFQSLVNETRISQEEMIDLFQQSKINLNLTASSHINYRNQIKGRNFEIPGCGGFQLSEYAERLEDFFILDKELVCYKTINEMLEKIRYYLSHDDERIAIAQAGYHRAMEEHTYEKRFNKLFEQMGLK